MTIERDEFTYLCQKFLIHSRDAVDDAIAGISEYDEPEVMSFINYTINLYLCLAKGILLKGANFCTLGILSAACKRGQQNLDIGFADRTARFLVENGVHPGRIGDHMMDKMLTEEAVVEAERRHLPTLKRAIEAGMNFQMK